MSRRKPRRSKFRSYTPAIMAAIALFAFGVVTLAELFHVAHGVNDALLDFAELFRQAVPLGTLLTSGFAFVFLIGLIWFHHDDLTTCWKRVSKQLPTPVLRNVAGALVFAGMLAVGLRIQAPLETKPAKSPQTTGEKTYGQVLPAAQDQNGKQPDEPAPSTLPVSHLRMTGRDVCDLFEDPTDAEWNACELHNRTHPDLPGKGGPVCIMIDGRISCLREALPPHRPGPPLSLLPDVH
jgi:hypothetical protein